MIFLVFAVVLMGMSAGFFYIAQTVEVRLPDAKNPTMEGKFADRLKRQLISWDHGVTGRLDFFEEHDGYPIPVLRKRGKAPSAPFDSHIAQVVAHCLLVEAMIEMPPPYGIIRYDDRAFEIDYDPTAFEALVRLVEEIRDQRDLLEPPDRSHDFPVRCHACTHRSKCNQKLV